MARKGCAILSILVAALVLQGVAVPCGLAPMTCRRLGDGSPGRIDQSYGGLPAWAAPIYVYGDLSCHQRLSHSFTLNGNQLPFCIRELFVYVGMALAAGAWALAPGATGPGGRGWRGRRVLLMAGLAALLPIFADASILPAISAWRCSAFSRIATGSIAGVGLVALFIAACHTVQRAVDDLSVRAAKARAQRARRTHAPLGKGAPS